MLKILTKVAAPFIPFVTENIYQNLRQENEPESVHLCDYPVYDSSYRDEELEFKMDTVQKAVSMGRSLRYQFNLKIRQPLRSVELVTRNPKEKSVLLEMEDSIREELNVKNVVFHEKEDELVEYRAKANFRVLGKELGGLMGEAARKIQSLGQNEILSILDGGVLSLDIGDRTVELTEDKIIVDRLEKEHLKVLNEGTLTVGLDTLLTKELIQEGQVRDLIRGIQNLRKEKGLDVTDRIRLFVSGTKSMKEGFESFKEFISSETLASEICWVEEDKADSFVPVETNEEFWKVNLEKA